jgi:hypothetical protein
MNRQARGLVAIPERDNEVTGERRGNLREREEEEEAT